MKAALRELEVDRAVYLADDATRTYRYLRRNPAWADLDPSENERNKRGLDGYTRVFPDGRTKRFTYRPPYTTRRRETMASTDNVAILTKARTTPDVVEMPPRRALAIDGSGAPDGEAFRRSLQALYGIAYTMKFARKKAGAGDLPIPPLEGEWRIEPGAATKDRDRWRWRLRLMVPGDVTRAELREAVAAATTKKGGKLAGSVEAARVFVDRIPRRRFGRILHVGPYATEPESFAVLEARLAEEGFRRAPWHTEVYLSDPGRTAPDKLRTTLLVEVDPARPKGRRPAHRVR